MDLSQSVTSKQSHHITTQAITIPQKLVTQKNKTEKEKTPPKEKDITNTENKLMNHVQNVKIKRSEKRKSCYKYSCCVLSVLSPVIVTIVVLLVS
ncbi:MAG: hypothetical protein AAF335_04065 [Bacteroidota bacterium]